MRLFSEVNQMAKIAENEEGEVSEQRKSRQNEGADERSRENETKSQEKKTSLPLLQSLDTVNMSVERMAQLCPPAL